jgi:hypothetical protein
MKSLFFPILAICSAIATATTSAEVKIDEAVFGKSLGGWTKRENQAAEYPLSGTVYRTYKPEVSPTPDGGIFVSIRIDHVRGWLSSDDHAILEITISPSGMIASAQSNIAIQGRSIASDVILGTNQAGQQIAGPTDRAVQIGTDLIADLSAKLLREKIVEAGRVSFPSVLRHNYNLLYQAVRWHGMPIGPGGPQVPIAKPVEDPGNPAKPAVPPATAVVTKEVSKEEPKEAPKEAPKESASTPTTPPATPPATAPASPASGTSAPAPANAPLEIKPYSPPGPSSVPADP